ncbi:MAG: PQ-loop domain-containing transporter [Pseudomonadota bacterium]
MNFIQTIVEIIFILGLFINAALFIPQAVKIFRLKDARGISLFTYAGFNIIQLLGMLHGYLQQDWVLFVGMGLSFLTCGGVTIGIIFFGKIRNN